MEIDNRYGKLNISCNNLEYNPHCPHGPTLLYERIQCNGKIQKYFACSAYRNRKHCSFFIPYGSTITDEKKSFWTQQKKSLLQNEKKHNYAQRLNTIKTMAENERGYCHTCNCVLFSKEFNLHKTHDVTKTLPNSFLNHPSQLLHLKTCSKGESQFIFSKKSVNVIINALKEFNVSNVICLGTPSIHERIRNDCEGITSLLLDFDNRYRQFYDETEFKWFNMMNFYFFDELKDYEDVKAFLSTENTVLIMDPPFSARAEPLGYTLSKFNSIYQHFHNKDLPVIWVFPYFKENEVLSCFSDMTMLDYDITYINHKSFRENANNKTSVVRIFTNLEASKFIFPEKEGYHFCTDCNYWVSRFNKHCFKCGICPSKNGQPYKHCDICSRCVKNYWQHCEKCGRCALQEHPCSKWQITDEKDSKKRKTKNEDKYEKASHVSQRSKKRKKKK